MTDGYTELAGGWCIPDSQMTGWPLGPRLPSRHYPDGILEPPPGFDYRVGPNESDLARLADEHGFAHTSIGYVPITAPRGGIKYPTSKGTTMPSLNHQLTALKNKQANLAAEIANLERKVKASRATPPPADQNTWTIDVRFNPNGGLYNYLILRHGGVFYTTGTGTDGKFFTWGSLLDWLDGMASHSALLPLRVDYERSAPLEGRTN